MILCTIHSFTFIIIEMCACEQGREREWEDVQRGESASVRVRLNKHMIIRSYINVHEPAHTQPLPPPPSPLPHLIFINHFRCFRQARYIIFAMANAK